MIKLLTKIRQPIAKVTEYAQFTLVIVDLLNAVLGVIDKWATKSNSETEIKKDA